MVTAFVAAITVALILFIGLVYDGGNILAARREAIDEAEGAARAAAQSVDLSARSGVVVVDPARIDAAVGAYLAPTGHRGIAVTDGRQVTVTVSFEQPMFILGIGGMVARRVSGRGTARPQRGIDGVVGP